MTDAPNYPLSDARGRIILDVESVAHNGCPPQPLRWLQGDPHHQAHHTFRRVGQLGLALIGSLCSWVWFAFLWFFVLTLALMTASLAYAKVSANSPDLRSLVKVGSTDASLTPSERQALQSTFLYLSQALPQYRFEVRSYPVSELEVAVKQGELDLFLASSGFYRRVYHRGLRDLVTMITPRAQNPRFGSGALFLVPRASNVHTLSDLKGKRAAISWREGFTGYFVPSLAIKEAGWDPERFFSSLVVGGSPMTHLVEALEEGRADVAFARACTYEEWLEREPDRAKRFRPVGVITEPVDGFHCLRSTPLFPNWTLVSTSSAPWQLSCDVTKTLLSMPAMANGTQWGVVSDFVSVDELYRTLRRGPFEYLRITSVRAFFEAYWPIVMLSLVIVLGLGLHSWRTAVLVRRRTRELQALNAKEKATQALAQEERRQRELLEQVSVVGAMSSLITHELNAPLNAISNSVRSLERFYERVPAPAVIMKAIDLIRRQSELAADIVQHVRGYAKRREIRLEPVDLKSVVRVVVRDQQIKHPAVTFVVNDETSLGLVAGERLELELCVTNLVKNAVEAMRSTHEKRVELTLTEKAKSVSVTVRDYGMGNEVVAATLFSQTLQSGKRTGLGLGLLIVRTIVERSAGRIEAKAAHPGLMVCITWPRYARIDQQIRTNTHKDTQHDS